MQLRICATVAWSCSPNTLSGLSGNWGACGFSATIVFAASAASRARCSLHAASRNVHQTGIDRWPGRSILPSGSRPASRAISRARSWYGSGRSIALHLAIDVCRRKPASASTGGSFIPLPEATAVTLRGVLYSLDCALKIAVGGRVSQSLCAEEAIIMTLGRLRLSGADARDLAEGALRGIGYHNDEARVIADHVIDAAMC